MHHASGGKDHRHGRRAIILGRGGKPGNRCRKVDEPNRAFGRDSDRDHGKNHRNKAEQQKRDVRQQIGAIAQRRRHRRQIDRRNHGAKTSHKRPQTQPGQPDRQVKRHQGDHPPAIGQQHRIVQQRLDHRIGQRIFCEYSKPQHSDQGARKACFMTETCI